MPNYDTEQGENGLDRDLIPWARSEWGLDVFLDEFPYYQYAGLDFDPGEDPDIQQHLELDYTPDEVPDNPLELGDYMTQKGPYRTDVVGVSVDRQALATRFRRVDSTEPLTGNGQAKRRRRRTFMTFTGDGPMTRDYWEQEHGGDDEVRGYGEGTARKAFGWLKKRGFLRPIGSRDGYDAVNIPLHIYGRTHAFEIKLEPNEWDTALEQAARADVFADFRWVVYDEATAGEALANADAFRNAGVGLITISPEGGNIHVWADRCTPEIDRDMLRRYNVERMDVNERVLNELHNAREWAERPPEEREQYVSPDADDILGELEPESLETEQDPPTVHAMSGEVKRSTPEVKTKESHKQLTDFTDV